MTDQMDRRLRELVQHLAAASPEAPPFPETAPAPVAPRRRIPAWVLATAGAAAVIVIIGLPFILWGGGQRNDVVTTPPAPTTAPSTPSTTDTTTPTTVPGIDPSACTPEGLLIRALGQDGAAGRLVTPVRFTNVSGDSCTLAGPLAVTGIGLGDEEVAAVQGTFVPIGDDEGPDIAAGDSRTMLLEVGTGCEGGNLVGPEAASVRVTIASGEVTIPFSGDLGCNFSYSEFGLWLDEQITDIERAVADALRAFAADPSPDNFAALPFTADVTLTLGPDAGREQGSATLAFPQNWVFDTSYDGFRAYTGPFSALDRLAEDRPVELIGGTHDHCASPPVPIYPAFEGLRQVSIQPADATSCLEWWTVDLFLTGDGDVAGITLDLYEP